VRRSRQAGDHALGIPKFDWARIDNNRRPALVHQIAAIEAFAKRPNPYQATFLSMVKRLLPALKMVRLDLAADLVESFIVAA